VGFAHLSVESGGIKASAAQAEDTKLGRTRRTDLRRFNGWLVQRINPKDFFGKFGESKGNHGVPHQMCRGVPAKASLQF